MKKINLKLTRHCFVSIMSILMLAMPMGAAQAKMLANQKDVKKKAETTALPVIWGNMGWRYTWTAETAQRGVYAFTPESPNNPTIVYRDDDVEANGGHALVDGKYYAVFWTSVYGDLFMEKNVYSVEGNNFSKISSSFIEDDERYMIAVETAQNKAGLVFGQFYNNEMSELEFGFVDYERNTRTTISQSEREYLALGLTNDNVAYGIDANMNLYRIDTKTGAETLVGSTGLVNNAGEGNIFYQSGEIDPESGIFYFTKSDLTGCGLYTIDLATAEATLVGNIDAEYHALVFPPQSPNASAPSKATDLQIAIEGPALNGQLSFSAPTTTIGGQPLSGSLSYKIYVGAEILPSGTCQPGEHLAMPVALEEGMNTVRVVFSNAAGEGDYSKISRFAGYDTPEPPANVRIEADGTQVSLSWDAPAKGENNGYLGELKYSIVRYPDEVVVSRDQTSTTYTETLPDNGIKQYYYHIYAKNNGKVSKPAASAAINIGAAIEPDYLEKFDTQEAFNVYSVVDANNDGSTWSWNEFNQSAAYRYNSNNTADDWLITPPIHVKKGWSYTVSFEARTLDENRVERIEAKYGYGPNVSDLTGEMQAGTDVVGREWKKFKKEITVTEDGYFYLGLHAISEADQYFLHVDNISVVEGANPKAPSPVKNLNVNPGKEGKMTAEITFDAPNTCVDGSPLESISRILIYRGDTQVTNISHPQPGAEQFFFDEEIPTNGNNTYRVVAFNDYGKGQEASATAFIGVDAPKEVTNVRLIDNVQSVRLCWDAVSTTGANGGYVNPNTVSYVVSKINEETYNLETITTVSGGNTQCDLTVPQPTNQGEQDLLQFFVTARNVAGQTGAVAGEPLLVGEPYSLPFNEGFAEGEATYFWWVSRGVGSGMQNAGFANGNDADGNNGMAGMEPWQAGDQYGINSGKISLSGVEAARLLFCHKNTPGCDSEVKVVIVKKDGTAQTLKTISYRNITTDEWNEESIYIPNEYLAEDYIQVQFWLTAGSKDLVYIDAVRIEETANGITTVKTLPDTFDIYNSNGQLVRKNATKSDLQSEQLQRGIYIIGNKKFIKK